MDTMESKVLEAAIEENEGELEHRLTAFLSGELQGLRSACYAVIRAIDYEVRRRQDSEQPETYSDHMSGGSLSSEFYAGKRRPSATYSMLDDTED